MDELMLFPSIDSNIAPPLPWPAVLLMKCHWDIDDKLLVAQYDRMYTAPP